MRSKFSELIEQGVANFTYTPIASNMPETDMVCLTYNNIFSIPSDTHMSKLEDGNYVITGHMINTEKWNRFVSAPRWGAVDFTTSGYWSVSDLLYRFGLQGSTATLNGDITYVIEPIPTAEPGEIAIPASFTMSESQIPHPIYEISTTGDMDKIKECFKDSLTATVKNLNESVYIRGNNWIEKDGDILGYNKGKVYFLNLSNK